MPPAAMDFTGEDTRDFDWEEIKGLVVSNTLVEGLDFLGWLLYIGQGARTNNV